MTKKALLAKARKARQKLDKKEQKEREKAERKERREQQKKEKAASKAAKASAKQESDAEEKKRKERPTGLGIPRSMSDPNLVSRHDENGLLVVDRPEGWIGSYSPESRRVRLDRFRVKRNNRVWTRKVKYDVRKSFADSRMRVKGRFVKKEDEFMMRDLMSLT
jgi:flagellar biosynthesis GTPase FlhF